KKNAQTANDDGGFAPILQAELGEGAEALAPFAARLGDRIELGLSSWKKMPTTGDVQVPYNITALAADLRGTYGENALAVVDQMVALKPEMAEGLQALRAQTEA